MYATGSCDLYAQAAESHYILPFKASDGFEVTQGNCSPLTHFGPQRYAYDFKTPDDTTLVAARGGIVIDKEEGNPNSVNLCEYGNYVMIQHDDGTVAKYEHLNKDGALVEIGDEVLQGQDIALSGRSGCSTGFPHLHFVVWIDDYHKYNVGHDSVPITFSNASPSIDWALQPGKTYSPK